jgi:hypothetical protein
VSPDREKMIDLLSLSIFVGEEYRWRRSVFLSEMNTFRIDRETNNLKIGIDRFVQDEHFVQIAGWGYIKDRNSENSEIYAVLVSDKKRYIFVTQSEKRPDVTAHFKTFNFDDSGFSVVISKDTLESGKYRLGIYIKKDDLEAFKYTDKIIPIGK